MKRKSTFKVSVNDFLDTYIKQRKGITLIALVVTIVVLIILAVISINSIFGENGLITSAQRAEVEHTHGTVWEYMEMEYSNYWIGKVSEGNNGLIEYLQKSYIIGENIGEEKYKINVEKLVGRKMALGNGTDNDVYMLEKVPGTDAGSTTKVASKGESIRLAETVEETEDKMYQVTYHGIEGDNIRKDRILGVLGDDISSSIEESNNPNFTIQKTRVGDPPNGEYYRVGEEIHYEIKATNLGTETMKTIKITDVLVAGSGTYIPQSDGRGELVLEDDSNGNIYAEDGCWVIDSLGSNQSETIRYSYTVQEGDVGEPIKNTITALTGKPKPLIPPKGEKEPEIEPDIEEEVQVPVLGSVPVKKILHMTTYLEGEDHRRDDDWKSIYTNSDCFTPTFELYNDNGFRRTCILTMMQSNGLPFDDMYMAYYEEPKLCDVEGSVTFQDIPVGEYKLREITPIEELTSSSHDLLHEHDSRIYDVSVLSKDETIIRLNDEPQDEAEFVDTCYSYRTYYYSATCSADGYHKYYIHISWSGWSSPSDRPILNKDLFIKYEFKSGWSDGHSSGAAYTWSVEPEDLVAGHDGWYAHERITCSRGSDFLEINNADGDTSSYRAFDEMWYGSLDGPVTPEDENPWKDYAVTLKLSNGDNIRISTDYGTFDKSGDWRCQT